MPVQITQLIAFIDENNIEQVVTQAHKIKGASYNVGANEFGELASLMEKAGKRGDMEAVKQFVTKINDKFEQLLSVIEETVS